MQLCFGTGPSEPESPACQKCGEATRLLSFLPRFGETPAYYVFECHLCEALTWLREHAPEHKPPSDE
jgi:hypothetical protein